MGECLGPFLLGDLDHPLGDEGAGNARAQKVLPFINRACLHHGVDEVPREFLLEIVNIDLFGSSCFRFLVEPFQLLFLADIGAKGDDFGLILFFEPGNQNRCVEASGICENDLHCG